MSDRNEVITYASCPCREEGRIGEPLDWMRLMIYDGDVLLHDIKEIDTKEGWYIQWVRPDESKPWSEENRAVRVRESRNLRIVRMPKYA